MAECIWDKRAPHPNPVDQLLEAGFICQKEQVSIDELFSPNRFPIQLT
jgi:hypothetical protein